MKGQINRNMMEKSIKIEKEESINNSSDEDDDIFLELWESTDFSHFNPLEEDEKNEKICLKKEVKIEIEPIFAEENVDSIKSNPNSQDKNSSRQTAADATTQKRTRSEILSNEEINDDVDDQEIKVPIIYIFDGRYLTRYIQLQNFFI